jgi:hypothetical protein
VPVPVYSRQCFEAVIRNNLDLGPPDRVSLPFPPCLNRRTPPGHGYKTYGVTRGLHVEFKHSRIKQYCETSVPCGSKRPSMIRATSGAPKALETSCPTCSASATRSMPNCSKSNR